jgi:LPXTG-site transpeptidase (sortase) family protein
MRAPAPRWPLIVSASLLAVGLALLAVAATRGPGPDSRAEPSGSGAGASRTTAAPDPAPPSPDGGDADEAELLAVPQSVNVAPPVSVEVPSLGIDTRLDRLGTDDRGRLDTPPRWDVAGWFSDGPRAGDAGPAVIAGHVDSPTGPAVFARLSELDEGDVIRVTDAGGTVREFAVTATTVTPRNGFPTEAVYGPTPDPQLRLITCDGPYDSAKGGYQDNLLVFASEVDA